MEMNLINDWDERWKLWGTVILTFSIAFSHKFYSLGFSLFFIIFFIKVSKIPWSIIKTSISPPLSMLLVMTPFILLTPGYSLSESINFLSIILIKSITIFLLFSILVNSSSATTLMHGMCAIGIPKKLILILISTYRYIFLYREDLKKLMVSAKLRGFSLQKGFKHCITSADILLTLIIRSYEQSQRVNAAMRLRGFTGNYKTMTQFNTTIKDVFLFIIVILGSLSIIILELKC